MLFLYTGFGVEGACLLALGFVTSGVQSLLLLIIGVGFSGVTISGEIHVSSTVPFLSVEVLHEERLDFVGWQINDLDLAPRYASVLVGITTTAGTIAGILNPILVGIMTENQVSAENTITINLMT